MGPLQQQWVWSHPCHELECAAFAQLCIAEPGTALELRAAQSATIDLRRHFRLRAPMRRLITPGRGDRKRGVSGKSVSVRAGRGGRRSIKAKKGRHKTKKHRLREGIMGYPD